MISGPSTGSSSGDSSGTTVPRFGGRGTATRISAVRASLITAGTARSMPGGNGSGGTPTPSGAGGRTGRIGRTGKVATKVASLRCSSVSGALVAVMA